MKAIKLSMLAAVILTAGMTTVKAQTADEILEKNAKAMGGSQAWENVKTLKLSGSMSQQGMDIGMDETMDLNKGIRIDISFMGMSGYQIITPQGGWRYMPFGGPAKIDTMKAEEAKESWSTMNIKERQTTDYKTKYAKTEYLGKDTINNAPCLKVKCVDKQGNESTNYFDASSYYLIRTEVKAKVNDEEQEVATSFGNYKKVDGSNIILPMTLSIGGGEINFKSAAVNVPVDPSIFIPTMPAADKK